MGFPRVLFLILFAAICSLFPVPSQTAFACPLCFGDIDPDQARGFFWGILFLMTLPFSMILYIAGHVIYHARKKARADVLIDRAESLIQEHLAR